MEVGLHVFLKSTMVSPIWLNIFGRRRTCDGTGLSTDNSLSFESEQTHVRWNRSDQDCDHCAVYCADPVAEVNSEERHGDVRSRGVRTDRCESVNWPPSTPRWLRDRAWPPRHRGPGTDDPSSSLSWTGLLTVQPAWVGAGLELGPAMGNQWSLGGRGL